MGLGQRVVSALHPGPVDEPVAQNELRAWHASLFERGQLVDFVHPESDLTGYQLIIVPALFQVEHGLAARLKDSGATVLVTCHTGYVGEDGHAIEGGYLGELGDLLGVRVREISASGCGANHSRAPGTAHANH